MTIKLNSTSSFAFIIHKTLFPLPTRPFINSWSFSDLLPPAGAPRAPTSEPRQLLSAPWWHGLCPHHLLLLPSQHQSHVPVMQSPPETPQGASVSANHWTCVQSWIYNFKDPCWQQDFHRLRVKEPICRKLLCSPCRVITLTAPQSSLTKWH